MYFSACWVGPDGPSPWPHSPAIAPLDFFLWRYVKDIVYRTFVASLNELKLRIAVAAETFTP
jgi:hypothetical protein